MENQLKAEAMVLYDQFVARNGELFRQEMIPMTEDDLKPVQKNDRFTRRVTAPVFYGVALCSLGGSIYLFFTNDWPIAIGMLLCSIALVSFTMYLTGYYSELISRKEKLVISGIITGKKKYNRNYGADYYLEVSKKKDVAVDQKQYMEFCFGDIIRYETLSEERYIRHSIALIGKISEYIHSQEPE